MSDAPKKPARPERRVETFDVTQIEDRALYEELLNERDVSVISEDNYAMGTGAIYRVVDYKEKPKPNGEFEYTPPIC